MSKNKNKIAPKSLEVINAAEDAVQSEIPEPNQPNLKASRWQNLLSYLKANALMVGIMGLLAFGALGSALKYLDEDAQREIARRINNKSYLNKPDESFLNKVNPFLPAPLPTPTPQLSKEYLYAGSRLLSVEDATLNTAPPADLAIWRPNSANNTGTWWVMGSQTSQQTSVQWGNASDVTVPGDYDGDGKTDFSIFRPSTGTWWILRTSDNGYSETPFGTTGDKVAQADYDGDGKTDFAVYRPNTTTHLGTWYIQRSSDGGYTIQQFGLDTDLPAAADYDGDGRADLGIWRGSPDYAFYSLNSSNNGLQTPTFGSTQTGDKIVSADYDGDGKADYTVYNSTTANWYLRQSTNSQIVGYQWGNTNDKPVQNDYDGDGKVDIAVWRESNGNWYIRKSGSNGALRQEQWGMPGDTPVPAIYRR